MESPSHRSAPSCQDCSRRSFLLAAGSAALSPSLLGCAASRSGLLAGAGAERSGSRIAPCGPASKYVPSLNVAFVRREEDYGMRWPGAIYDGQAALRNYKSCIEQQAEKLGMKLAVRPTPIYSDAEAEQWIAAAKADAPDGLLVVLLDRQQHAWPTAGKAIESNIPAVVFAPLGAAFTVNTAGLAEKGGAFICCTDDFAEVAYGMRMIVTGAKLREMRYIVLHGDERRDTEITHFGTKLRYLPAGTFLDEYKRTGVTDEVRRIASEYVKHATKIAGPRLQDVHDGVRSYVVARRILEREGGDGITMACLRALGHTKVSLPCIAWSKMLDEGIPAACEADLGAAVTHALVQYLFDRPGFQQDPVPETARSCLIGAHCTCPTRLNGFGRPPEPYYLSHHHGKRDAVPRPMWRLGQRITVADVVLSNKETVAPQMIISSGEVVENIAVPPAGGCVVAVMVRLDGVSDLLAYPGFHQLFFYGDYKRQLQAYCKLFKIRPVVI